MRSSSVLYFELGTVLLLPASRWGTCGRSACNGRRGPRSPRGRARGRRDPARSSCRLCVSSASGFTWSMNCESCEEPKNSLMAATMGLMETRSWGRIVSVSLRLMRSLAMRSMRPKATLHHVGEELADRAHAAVAEVVDIVDVRGAVVHVHQVLHRRDDVRANEGELLHRHRVVEFLVELVAARPCRGRNAFPRRTCSMRSRSAFSTVMGSPGMRVE